MTATRFWTARRLLGAMAVVALGAGSFAAGVVASGVTRPSYAGLELVSLPAAPTALPTDVLDPFLVLRADGTLVTLGATGYIEIQLPAATTRDLIATLAAAPDWKASYPLPGLRAIRRVELRLLGAGQRAITIDDPLGNPTLPDPLFRLVASLLRPVGGDAPAIDPPALRVRTVPVAADEDTTVAEAEPAWLDAIAAASLDGQTLAGAALTAAMASAPWLGGHSDQLHARIVRVEGTALQLVWGADWTDWMKGDR